MRVHDVERVPFTSVAQLTSRCVSEAVKGKVTCMLWGNERGEILSELCVKNSF